MSALPAVRHSVRVALAPADAFALFTRGMSRWWPFRGHSCFADEAADVQFEPRAGGAVMEVARNGERMAWGTLTEWAPPRAFAMRWHPGLPAAEATWLQVRFDALPDGGTEVSIEHGGWEARGAAAQAKRDQYDGGWPTTLAAFVRCSASINQEGT